MVAFVSKFDPRKGQFQVKLGQIGSNFKIQNFLTKTCLSYPVLHHDSKNVIHFYVRQLEMPKVAIQKSDVITDVFLPLHSQKSITVKFGMCVLCM